MGLSDRPLVCSGCIECYCTEARCVSGRILRYCSCVIGERRRVTDRRDRELELIVRRPCSSVQSLADLDLAFT